MYNLAFNKRRIDQTSSKMWVAKYSDTVETTENVAQDGKQR